MTAAPCAGQWQLFDSIEQADHVRAKTICQACPLIDTCRMRLNEARRMARSGGIRAEYGPAGTWAGELVGAKPKKKLPPIEHGTLKGAYTHRNRKLPVCNLCRAAERLHLAEMRAKLKRERAA